MNQTTQTTGATSSGDVIGKRYRILGQIGQGSFSKVYLAEDEKGKREHYAVKVLKSEMADADTIRRFQREIQLTQQLDHAHIVRIISSGITESGAPYLVTEYLPSGDLRGELRHSGKNGLPFLRCVNLIRFTADGLGHAHERKILHRDIKPENVLLTPARNLKISDFGIGLSLRFNNLAQTLALGTPWYMSPEQIEQEELGPWTDVYALGIMSFELLTGDVPFTSSKTMEVVRMQCEADLPSILAKRPGVPCWMEDFVRKACEKDPARRYRNGREMLDALERAIQKDRAALPFPAKLFYWVQPDGKACTYFTEKGVPRRILRLYFFMIIFFLALLLLRLAQLSA